MENVGEKFLCPNCGVLVSRSDVYCKKCGINLSETVREKPSTVSLKGDEPAEEAYQRRFSMIERFLKLLISPSEAMKDIALAPSYEGIAVICIAEAFTLIVTLELVFQKIKISGPYSNMAIGMIQSIMVLAILFGVVIFIIKWAVKSLIVKHACDSGSAWEFKSAASITSYAYIADVALGIVGLVVSWFLIPTFHIDTANLDAATQYLTDYQAQITWLKLAYTLPLSLLGLLWKSYLGGLGARFGTKERCSLRTGITVFFGLGLIGLLITLLL